MELMELMEFSSDSVVPKKQSLGLIFGAVLSPNRRIIFPMPKTLFRGTRFLLAALMTSGSISFSANSAPSIGENDVLPRPLPIMHKVFAVVVDDIDRDGRPDLLVTYRSEGTAQVLYQKAPRQFEAGPPAKILGFHPDGLTRFPGVERRYVLSAEGDTALRVLGVDEAGNIKAIADHPQEGPFATTAFTWPNWGTSLAVVPYEGYGLFLLRNFQPETAQVEKEFVLGKPEHRVPGEVTVADLNGDGIPELLYTTRRSRTLWRVNYPKDNRDPEPVAIWKTPVGAPRHLAIADLNGDGAPDILLPLESERRIAVLLNDGKGEFTPGPELPVPSDSWSPHRLAVAEDRDGSLLLVAGTENSLMIYRIEKGNPYRYKTFELPLGSRVNQVLLLRDIDGDGNLDLLLTLSKIEDSLQILYGPLWKKLTKEGELAKTDQPASPQPELPVDTAITLTDDPTQILARVGDHPITLAEFREFVLHSGRGDELRTKSGQTKLLHDLIEQALIDQAIKAEQSTSKSSESYATILRSLEDAHFPAPPLPDETALKAYYDANKEQFGIPEMVRLVQIQFRADRNSPEGPNARQRAEQALRRIEAGEDFNKVASELTENPRAKETGPDRGFVARNAVPWLQDAVRGLQPGQHTGIVSSPVGYEILLMTDSRPALIADYNVVRDKVAKQWQAEQQQQARTRYLQALAEQFGVTILEKGLENANPAKR